MFPIPWNFPFRKKDGSLGKIEDLGGTYTLPTASADTKGGVKIGSGLTMNGEVLSAAAQFTPDYVRSELVIGTVDDWEYYIPMLKRYAGDGIWGYEIKTNPESSSSTAMIDLYTLIYVDGEATQKEKIKTLVHNGDKNYSDEWISITYSGSNWSVTFSDPIYNEEGTAYTSPVSWAYSETVDYVMLTEDPTA